MQDENPLSVQSIAPIPWTFLHVDIHLLHNIHLLKSLTILGDLSSISCLFLSPLYLISVTPNSCASLWSSQFPISNAS